MKTNKQGNEEMPKESTSYANPQLQQSGYRNAKLIAFLPLLFLLPMLYFSFSGRLDRLRFEDYRDEISTRIINQDTIQVEGQKMINILVEVVNKTAEPWEDAIYEVRYLSSSGDLLNVEKDSDYKFILGPNGKAISCVKIPLYEEYQGATMELELAMLRHDR